MKFIIGSLMAVILGGGIGMFLGIINKVIDQVGATYYWQAVGAGLFAFAVIYMTRLRKGYDVRGNAVYVLPLTLLCGAIGIPNTLILMDLEMVSKVDHFGTLMSFAAFVCLLSCGFAGTLEQGSTKTQTEE